MRQIDEQLKHAQEQQAARQEDLQKGRIRIERPRPERETVDHPERQKAAS